MAVKSIRYLILGTVAIAALSGCEPGSTPVTVNPPAEGETTAATPATPATSVAPAAKVGDDVEAPQVFQVTDTALWDGRPSLGGVWVASPDANDPERVIMRNPANGKFVIGALFRRERDNPGPTLQISSDAAVALGMLAGQPGDIKVTALRREEVLVAAPAPSEPVVAAVEPTADAAKPAAPVSAPATVAAKPAPASSKAATTDVIDTVALADAAITEAEGKPAAANAGEAVAATGATATAATAAAGVSALTPAQIRAEKKKQKKLDREAAKAAKAAAAAEAAALDAQPTPPATTKAATSDPATSAAPSAAAPAPAPVASGDLIQIGIFSVEANATTAVKELGKSGIAATTKKEESQGKAYWSVTAKGNSATLAKIKAAGFKDAYVLKRG